MHKAALILALSAAPALADPRLAGRYEGVIQSGEVEFAATTVLTVTQDGRIAGTYSFKEETGVTEGSLKGCTFSSPILSCFWFDRYGSGELVVAFSPGMNSFRGSWYGPFIPGPHDSPDGGLLWTGARP